MGLNRLEQVAGPAVVQEEQPLADAPQRRSAELIPTGRALADMVRQAVPHVMQSKVGERMNLLAGERRERTGPGGEHGRVAVGAADIDEFERSPRHGAVDGAARRRSQETHEIGEIGGVVEYRGVGEPTDIEDVVWRR